MADLHDNLASNRTIDVSLLVVSALVVGSALLLSPAVEDVHIFGYEVPVLCGFRRLTGANCPGCGLTRSFSFMAHGLVVEAFRVNWMGPVAFLAVASQLPYRTWRLFRSASPPEVIDPDRRAHAADQ